MQPVHDWLGKVDNNVASRDANHLPSEESMGRGGATQSTEDCLQCYVREEVAKRPHLQVIHLQNTNTY